MKTQCWILAIAILMSIAYVVRGNVIFSQDFSTNPDGPLTTYYNPTAPNDGQWNAITASGTGTRVTVANGALSFTRGSSGAASFSRTTDFSPAPEAVRFRFDLGMNSASTRATDAAVWQIGSGFSTANAAQADSTVHSQFALSIVDATGSFQFRNPKTGAESSAYSGKFPVTWVVNNSSSAIQYSAPNGTTRSVAADHWDLWCGPYPVFYGIESTTAGQSLTDLKFVFSHGGGTINMDNFSLEPLSAVPEPAATGTVVAACLGLAAVWKRWRCATRGT